MSIPSIPYSEIIAKKVREGVRNGVSIKDIMGSIQKYQNAPSSTATFYKLYGTLIAETKADIVAAIGNVVVTSSPKSSIYVLRVVGHLTVRSMRWN